MFMAVLKMKQRGKTTVIYSKPYYFHELVRKARASYILGANVNPNRLELHLRLMGCYNSITIKMSMRKQNTMLCTEHMESQVFCSKVSDVCFHSAALNSNCISPLHPSVAPLYVTKLPLTSSFLQTTLPFNAPLRLHGLKVALGSCHC